MSPSRLLVVHPEPTAFALLASMLQSLGYRIDEARNDRVAVRMLEQGPVHLVLAGVNPHDPEAMELLSYIRRKHPATPVVLLFQDAHPERVKEATRMGAAAILKYPVPANSLRAVVIQALEKSQAATAPIPTPTPSGNGHHANHVVGTAPAAFFPAPAPEPAPRPAPENNGSRGLLLGEDSALRQTAELVETIAPTRTPVLILGERGTGKSLVARMLHAKSPRQAGAFVEVACSAAKEAALEAELFGHPGVYTGDPAGLAAPGKVGQAQGGTLFLDEVAALSPRLQAKLFRLIQDHEYEPVGSSRAYPADVRVVAASRENLAALVDQGQFRQDLYYRISIVSLKLPPLRQRGSDLERLAEHFRARFAREIGKDVVGFTPEAIEALRAYSWPGNVRELEAAVERGVVLARGPRIIPANLILPQAEPAPPTRSYVAAPVHTPRPHVSLGLRPLKEALEEPEKQIILRALEALNWNRQETARVLDINRTTLYKKMKKYGLLMEEPAWIN